MTSTTKNTTTKNTSPAAAAVRPVQRGHQVAVQFSAHGVRRVDVHAHASGGRGDQPYIAVTVGDCLTYLYDRDALAAHVRPGGTPPPTTRACGCLPHQPPPRSPVRTGGRT